MLFVDVSLILIVLALLNMKVVMSKKREGSAQNFINVLSLEINEHGIFFTKRISVSKFHTENNG